MAREASVDDEERSGSPSLSNHEASVSVEFDYGENSVVLLSDVEERTAKVTLDSTHSFDQTLPTEKVATTSETKQTYRQETRYSVASTDAERSKEFLVWFQKTWSGHVSSDRISTLTSTIVPPTRSETPEKRGGELRCRLLWFGALMTFCGVFTLIWFPRCLLNKTRSTDDIVSSSPSSSPSVNTSTLVWEELFHFSPYHLVGSKETSLAFGGNDHLAVASTINGGIVKVFYINEQKATEVGLPMRMEVIDPDSIVVKLSHDGNRLAVAATSTTDLGSVKVFRYDNNTSLWSLQAEWKGERTGDGLGSSMDMTTNGERLVFVDSYGSRARVYGFTKDTTPQQLGPALFFDSYDGHTVATISEDLLGMGDDDGVYFYRYLEKTSTWGLVEPTDTGHLIGGPEHSVAPGGALALSYGRTGVTVCGFLKPYGELLCQETINLDNPVEMDSYIGLTFEEGFDLDKVVLVQDSRVSVFEYGYWSQTWGWMQRGDSLELESTSSVPIVTVSNSRDGVIVASASFGGSMGSIGIFRLSTGS